VKKIDFEELTSNKNLYFAGGAFRKNLKKIGAPIDISFKPSQTTEKIENQNVL
jgi:hypothetical protein